MSSGGLTFIDVEDAKEDSFDHCGDGTHSLTAKADDRNLMTTEYIVIVWRQARVVGVE